jgi:hypothetical protein
LSEQIDIESVCKECRLIAPTKEYPPDNRPKSHGVRVYRSFDWMEGGSIRIVAKRRIEGVKFARGFILARETMEDLAGDLPMAQQLANPAVVAEIERLTDMAVASVEAAEKVMSDGQAIQMEWLPLDA